MLPYFSAGKSLQNALRTATQLRRRGFRTLLESVEERWNPKWTPFPQEERWKNVLQELKRHGLERAIGVSLQNPRLESLQPLALEAHTLGGFVQIAFRDYGQWGAHLEMFKKVHTSISSMCLLLPADLRRSHEDILALLPLKVRFCLIRSPGLLPLSFGFSKPKEKEKQYFLLARRLLGEGLHSFCIQTAQEALEIADYARQEHLPPETIEMQFSLGWYPKLARQMLERGFSVRIRIPFGSLHGWSGLRSLAAEFLSPQIGRL